MADKKISALTGATTPLAGTEVLPIVQGGATVNVSVANLTAGRAISATQLTLTTGNLIVANGQGIDFSLTPGTGTSELLDDYEEGTWTPTLGGTTTYNTQVGTYTKVGRLVTINFLLDILAIGDGTTTQIEGVPFTSFGSNRCGGSVAYVVNPATAFTSIAPVVLASSTSITFTCADTSGAWTVTGSVFATGSIIAGTITYTT